MKWKKLFTDFLKCFNPNTYHGLTAKPLTTVVNQFLFNISFLFIIMIILLLILSPSIGKQIDSIESSFETFDIDYNISMQHAVTVLSHPMITIDKTQKHTGEFMLINGSDINYMQFYYFGKANIPLSDFESLNENSAKILKIIIYLMLPSLIILYFIALLVKYLILTLVLGTIYFLFIHLLKQSINYMKLIKIGLFISVFSLIIDTIVLPFIRLPIVSIILFAVIYLVTSVLTADRSFSDHKEHIASKKIKKKPKYSEPDDFIEMK